MFRENFSLVSLDVCRIPVILSISKASCFVRRWKHNQLTPLTWTSQTVSASRNFARGMTGSRFPESGSRRTSFRPCAAARCRVFVEHDELYQLNY